MATDIAALLAADRKLAGERIKVLRRGRPELLRR
jgi:hypothetical protein